MPGAGTVAALYSLTERAGLAFFASPQPDRTSVGSDALAGFLTSLSKHVLVLIDEDYDECVDEPGYPHGVAWAKRSPTSS